VPLLARGLLNARRRNNIQDGTSRAEIGGWVAGAAFFVGKTVRGNES